MDQELTPLPLMQDPGEDPGLTVIVPPEGQTVAFRGEGDLTLVCGSCGTPLIVGRPRDEVQYMSIRCNNCGRYNWKGDANQPTLRPEDSDQGSEE